jgi:hypothetical protein
MEDEMKMRLSDRDHWLRLLWMALYALALYFLVAPLVVMVALVQFLFVLLSGERNEQLRSFGASLAEFARQAVRYLAFDSNERPFPFAEWPKAGGEQPAPTSGEEGSS